jgi:tetratricopeptide (TPR) repeat protein
MGAPGAGPVLARHFELLLTENANVSLNRSLALFNQQRFGDAVEAAQQALTINPNLAEAYNNMSAAYTALGQWDNAIQAARRALDLKPDFQLARNNLNWARAKQSQATASSQPQ